MYRLPHGLNKFLRLYIYYPFDLVDTILGNQEKMTPPKSLIRFGGYGRNVNKGNEFLSFFKEKCSLKKTDSVLDMGCGVGLIAIPVLNYLKSGKYEGLDILKESINWCNKNIAAKFCNAHFMPANIINTSYNPKGTIFAKEYKFPYDSETFDFIWLKSVFTHMRPSEIKRYIFEISRVLKSRGKCLITYFLLESESRYLIKIGKSSLNFFYEFENCLTTNPNIPEDAIAYDIEEIESYYKKCGLFIESIYLGRWCSRDNITQTITG